MNNTLKKLLLACVLLVCTVTTNFANGIFVKVSAAGEHSIAIANNGTLWAWGTNSSGELGDGTTNSRLSALQIGVANDWQTIAAGEFHNLALKTDGTLWAWGNNSSGQLGDGSTSSSLAPIQIGTDANWKFIAAGASFSVALKTDGTLWAWGSSGNGQLGDGAIDVQHSPIQIGTDADWAFLSAGAANTFAVKSNGTLWAWGRNSFGQLGDGSTNQQTAPIQIGSDSDWNTVAAGFFHTLALKTNGTLWAWGGNFDGQLGDSTEVDEHSPIQIGSASDWKSVSAGQTHSAALTTNGTIWAWGFNWYGQVGDGTTNNVSSPTQIGSDTDWTMLVAGLYHTLALKPDGAGWDCGRNDGGQLANGTTINRSNLVKVLLTANITLGSLTQAYDGTPKSVAITIDPPSFTANVTYDGSPTAPTNSGSYAVVATGFDSDYYGQTTGTLVISPATATVTLSGLTQYFDGTGKTISVTTVPPGLAVNVTYNGLSVPPTAIGSYPVVATITDPNYQGSVSNNLVITNLPNALAKGTYTGLFYQSNNVTFQSSGYFNMTVDSKFKIGGKIYIEDANFPLAGVFDTNTGAATVSVNSLTLTLQLSSDGSSSSVSGSVSDGVWTASLFGNKSFYNLATPCPLAGNYAMTLQGVGDGATAPNYGTRGVVKVKPTGAISLSGNLADDSAMNQGAVLSKNGQWPVYVKLYKNTGSMLGWITFTNLPDSKFNGSITWIKPSDDGKFYSAGFTNTMTAVGSIRQ